MAGCMILKIINTKQQRNIKKLKKGPSSILLPSSGRLQWISEGLGMFEDGAGPHLQVEYIVSSGETENGHCVLPRST